MYSHGCLSYSRWQQNSSDCQIVRIYCTWTRMACGSLCSMLCQDPQAQPLQLWPVFHYLPAALRIIILYVAALLSSEPLAWLQT